MPLNLTELLLLIIVIGGAAYCGYLLGRWSVLREQADDGRGDNSAGRGPSPLPGPSESTWEAPRRTAAPPPASAGGTHADASGGLRQSPRSSAPPASAGSGPVTGGSGPGSGSQPRRTAAPPPARAGLMDTGSTGGSADKGKPGGAGGRQGKRST